MSGTVYQWDKYQREAKTDPFVLDTGEQQIVVRPPTTETILEIGETPLDQGRRLLQLLCGDQFDTVYELVKDAPATAMTALVKDMVAHFGVDQELPQGGFAASSR